MNKKAETRIRLIENNNNNNNNNYKKIIIIKKSKAKQTRAGFAVSTILQKYSSSILERNPITAFVKILATISNKIFNNSHLISFSMFFDY